MQSNSSQPEKFPSFNWYPRDWLVGTVRLTAEQKGMFADLLSYAWDQTPPCTVPDDDVLLAKWAGVTLTRWRKAGAVVRAKFQPIGDGLLRNNKQWTVYQQAVENRNRKRRSGKQGADKRWHSHSDAITPPVPDRMAESSLPISMPIPIPEKQKKNVTRSSTLPDDWQPNDTHREVAAKLPGILVSNEVENFRDHHRAKGSRFKDWDAAFRTWLRNAAKFASNRPAQASQAAAVREEKPQAIAKRSGEMKRASATVDADDDDARIGAWQQKNAEEAALMLRDCYAEVAGLPGAAMFGEFTSRKMAESKFRSRVIAEFLTPKLAAS